MKYNNILFDLYGTLIDLHTNETKATLWRHMAGIFSMQGASYEAGELKAAYLEECRREEERLLPKIRKEFKDELIPLRDIEIDIEAVLKRLYENKGVKADHRLCEFSAEAFRCISLSYIKLFPGTKLVLDTIRKNNQKAYLVSNAQALFTVPELKAMGLYDRFDGILISSDVGIKKPSRYIFDKALEKFGLDKSSCIMVGNDKSSDVAGARAAGIDSIFVNTGQEGLKTTDDPLPDGVIFIEDISEVLKHI